MTQRNRRRISADFPGANTPAGSVVVFDGPNGQQVRGRVMTLRLRHADVAGDDGFEWSVPYRGITGVESVPESECTLEDVEELAGRIFGEAKAGGILGGDWDFGFDLAPSRAGVCRYAERRIDLSVSYCQAATRAEIEDTILHEIAHAIVGPRHNHDRVWKAKAREIGCQGERCHRVQQSIPKWIGECGCGNRWTRQTLQRRMMVNRVCAGCRGEIAWRRNTDAEQ